MEHLYSKKTGYDERKVLEVLPAALSRELLGYLYKGQVMEVPLFRGLARQSPLPYDVRFLPVSQYLLELASGLWVLECGVLTSREA